MKLLVIAAHHLSANVASNRFRELIKYFGSSIEVHVVARADSEQVADVTERRGVTIHAVPGGCVGSGLTLPHAARALAFAACGGRGRVLLPNDSWLSRVTKSVESIMLSSDCSPFAAVIASYSPIDALIAAKWVGYKFGVPVILDFRDGFVFESLGRPGRLPGILRSFVEAVVIRGSSLLTTVSRPLLEDFARRYKGQRVALLPNGYDPEELEPRSEALAEASAILSRLPADKLVIGHFGRIGASDATRTRSFNQFVASLSRYPGRHRLHLLFVGTLTTAERDVLAGLDVSHTLVPNVAREVALALMKMTPLLLLVTGAGTGCATGKIFEYIATRNPVICHTLVENEASRILQEVGAGVTVLAGDTDSLTYALDRWFSGELATTSDESGLMMYRRDQQAANLLSLVEEVSKIPARSRC